MAVSERRLTLPHHPDLHIRLRYSTSLIREVRTLNVIAPVSVAIVLLIISVLFG
ncbi:hypothetical protein SJI19_07105 [Acerihabitans sp. TG2]|uniref:hypothetical protein n=1 Tax=Acerihabitans sp. TG2 TaxID=3096008 RepID=UPI002B226F17|nr:hypothetical protein [Acerihabitans sp. TG2]MEA9390310.1 hypothetical protein [Acerihabitans sp. TG2]